MAPKLKMLISLVVAFCVCASAHAYTLRVESASHGSVRLSKTTAMSGDTVTLLVQNDNGYWVDHMVIMDNQEDVLPIQWNAHNQGINRYYITMPACDITIRPFFSVFAPVNVQSAVSNGELCIRWDNGYTETAWQVVISEGDNIQASEDPILVKKREYRQMLDLNTHYTALVRAYVDSENYSEWVNAGEINGPSCTDFYRLEMSDYSYQGQSGAILAYNHDGDLVATYRVPQGEGSTSIMVPTADVARFVYKKGSINDIFRYYFYDGDFLTTYGPVNYSTRTSKKDGATVLEPYDCQNEYCPHVVLDIPITAALPLMNDTAQLHLYNILDSALICISDRPLTGDSTRMMFAKQTKDDIFVAGGFAPGRLYYAYTQNYCPNDISYWESFTFLAGLADTAVSRHPGLTSSLYQSISDVTDFEEEGTMIMGGLADSSHNVNRYYTFRLTAPMTLLFNASNASEAYFGLWLSDNALLDNAVEIEREKPITLSAGTYYLRVETDDWTEWNELADRTDYRPYRLTIKQSTTRPNTSHVQPLSLPVAHTELLDDEHQGVVYAVTMPADMTYLQVAIDFSQSDSCGWILSSDSLLSDTLLISRDSLVHWPVAAGQTLYLHPFASEKTTIVYLMLHAVDRVLPAPYVCVNEQIVGFYDSSKAVSHDCESYGDVESVTGRNYVLHLESSMMFSINSDRYFPVYYTPLTDVNASVYSHYEGDSLAAGDYFLLLNMFELSNEGYEATVREELPYLPDEQLEDTIPLIHIGDTIASYIRCGYRKVYKLRLSAPADIQINELDNTSGNEIYYIFTSDSTQGYWGDIATIYHADESYATLPADSDIYVIVNNFSHTCDFRFTWKIEPAVDYTSLDYQPLPSDTTISLSRSYITDPILRGIEAWGTDLCGNSTYIFSAYQALYAGYRVHLKAGVTYHMNSISLINEVGYQNSGLLLLTDGPLTGHLGDVGTGDILVCHDYMEFYNDQVTHSLTYTPDHEGDYRLLMTSAASLDQIIFRLQIWGDPLVAQSIVELLDGVDEVKTYDQLPIYDNGAYTAGMLPVRDSAGMFCYGEPEQVITTTYPDSVPYTTECWNVDRQEYIEITYNVPTDSAVYDTTYVTEFSGMHYSVARAIQLRSGDRFTVTSTSAVDNILFIYYKDRAGAYHLVDSTTAGTLCQYTSIAQHSTVYYAVLTTREPLQKGSWTLTISTDKYTYLLNPNFNFDRPRVRLVSDTDRLIFTHKPTLQEVNDRLMQIRMHVDLLGDSVLAVPNLAEQWTMNDQLTKAWYVCSSMYLYGDYRFLESGDSLSFDLLVSSRLQTVDTLLTFYAIPTEQDIRSMLSQVRLDYADDSGIVGHVANLNRFWTVDMTAMTATCEATDDALPEGYIFLGDAGRLMVRLQVEANLTSSSEEIALESMPTDEGISDKTTGVRLYADVRGEEVTALSNYRSRWKISRQELTASYTATNEELPVGYIFARDKQHLTLPVNVYLSNLKLRADMSIVYVSSTDLQDVSEALCEIQLTVYSGNEIVCTVENMPEAWVFDRGSMVATYMCPDSLLPTGFFNTGRPLRVAVEVDVLAATDDAAAAQSCYKLIDENQVIIVTPNGRFTLCGIKID